MSLIKSIGLKFCLFSKLEGKTQNLLQSLLSGKVWVSILSIIITDDLINRLIIKRQQKFTYNKEVSVDKSWTKWHKPWKTLRVSLQLALTLPTTYPQTAEIKTITNFYFLFFLRCCTPNEDGEIYILILPVRSPMDGPPQMQYTSLHNAHECVFNI